MNNRRSLRTALVLTFILSTAAASSLELTDGNLALVIHEDNGRFSLYSREAGSRARPVPLFVDQDPRTSFSTVLINNRAYRLGETSVFRLSVEKANGQAILRWVSPIMRIEHVFSFVRNPNNSDEVFLRLDVRLYNTDAGDIDVGYRLTLDTNLGERGESHFITNSGRAINDELVIFPQRDGVRHLISANERASFMVSVQADGLVPPDSIHIANWKRLTDAHWKIPHQDGRNFNNLPYSVGDSALSFYYNHRRLARGEQRAYTILMGSGNNSGFPPLLTAAATQPIPAPRSPQETDLSLLRDLQELQTLIDRLERAKLEGVLPSDTELKRMEELLNRLSGYIDI